MHILIAIASLADFVPFRIVSRNHTECLLCRFDGLSATCFPRLPFKYTDDINRHPLYPKNFVIFCYEKDTAIPLASAEFIRAKPTGFDCKKN